MAECNRKTKILVLFYCFQKDRKAIGIEAMMSSFNLPFSI